MPWASTGWEYCKSDPRWHFLLKYRQPQDITHLPAWIAIHTNELISGGKLLLPEWVGEETSLTLQPEKDSGFLAIFCCFFQLLQAGLLHMATHSIFSPGHELRISVWFIPHCVHESHTLLCKGTTQSIHTPHHAHRRFSITRKEINLLWIHSGIILTQCCWIF